MVVVVGSEVVLLLLQLLLLQLAGSDVAPGTAPPAQRYRGPVILCAGIPDASPGDRYMVTMAVTSSSNPQIIYSTFASGVDVNVTQDMISEQRSGSERESVATVCLPWDGLDDNYMPVVPGTYAAAGIATKAATWTVDGKVHAITAEFAAAALPFAPSPQEVAANLTGYNFHVIGDPVGSSMMAITVNSQTNTAVFYHGYLENSFNNFMVNLSAPIGWKQCLNRFDSGGAAGGNATTTDGTVVWSQSSNGGNALYRADERPWGSCNTAYRKNVFCPNGEVMAMTNARNTKLNTSKLGFTTVVIYATQAPPWVNGSVSEVVFLDGYDSNAKQLAKVVLSKPLSLDVRDSYLFALHSGRTVSKLRLEDGLPAAGAAWTKLFDLASSEVPNPTSMAVGSGGKLLYVSDSTSNIVAKIDGTSGTRLLNFGDSQQVPVPEPASGSYNPTRLMGPTSIAVWAGVGSGGSDHVLVLETRGPARIGEWDAGGTLVRSWMTPQTKANDGWVIDADHPDQVYVMQQGVAAPPPSAHWAKGAQYLNRFKLDLQTGKFEADAVFPNMSNTIGPPDPNGHNGGNPNIYHANGNKFVGFQKGLAIFKFRPGLHGEDDAALLPSAGIVAENVCVPNTNPVHGGAKCETSHDCSNAGSCDNKKCTCKYGWRGDKCQFAGKCTVNHYVFADANGDGKAERTEWEDAQIDMPPGCPAYFGDTIAADLAILCVSASGGTDVYRLPVTHFDSHSNPIYARNWTVALTDPFFENVAKAAAENTTAAPLQGGNEVISKWNTSSASSPLYNVPALNGNGFTSDWSMAIGTPETGYVVNARSGASFNADKGEQHKLSRYGPVTTPGSKPKMLWRVGRESLRSDDPPAGQIVSSMRTNEPMLGMIGIIDQSMAGVHIYTEDGLYVDSAFISGSYERTSLFGLPGEFFAGRFFLNTVDGHVYAQMGKASMVLFRPKGWSNSTVLPLKMQNTSFTVDPGLISPPDMDALAIRLHSDLNNVKTAVFRRSKAPPALDGSDTGWEVADTNISLWSDGAHHVTAQLLHDDDHLYIRAVMKLGSPLQPVRLLPDFQRLFTHGRGATTLSFYLQSNVTFGEDCPASLCNTGGQVCNPGSWNVTQTCAHCYCHVGHGNNNPGWPSAGATRIVLGVFDTTDNGQSLPKENLEAVAVGLYPGWSGNHSMAQPYIYGTQTTGQQRFDNVQLLNETRAGLGVRTDFLLDDARTTLTLVAALPVATVFPPLTALTKANQANLSTGFDLSCTMMGHNKFWWESRDFSCSTITYDEGVESELYLRGWGRAVFA